MTYFTGDIHGSPIKIQHFCRQMNLTANDTVVILGDVGANYYGDSRDGHMKKRLAALAPTIFCIHGNHERRPSTISDYELTTWNGGAVWVQPEYPNLLFAKDGEVFNIDGIVGLSSLPSKIQKSITRQFLSGIDSALRLTDGKTGAPLGGLSRWQFHTH